MPTDKQRAAFFSATKSRLLQTKTEVAKDLEKAVNAKKEEETKEANVDDISTIGLDIGKCKLDDNEVRY
jgi:Na+/pantothenate symporter